MIQFLRRYNIFKPTYPSNNSLNRSLCFRLHLDLTLFWALLILCSIGLIILYSASQQNYHLLIRQILRLIIAFGAMFLFAQISPNKWRLWAPWLYTIGLSLLFAVLYTVCYSSMKKIGYRKHNFYYVANRYKNPQDKAIINRG